MTQSDPETGEGESADPNPGPDGPTEPPPENPSGKAPRRFNLRFADSQALSEAVRSPSRSSM